MSLKYKKPSKVIIISNMFSDLDDTYHVVKNFKLEGIQPGVFKQHEQGVYEEVFAINEDDLIKSLEDKSVFISTSQKEEDVQAGSSLSVGLERLQEYGLTLGVGENDQFGKIVIKYDPELEHLHSSDNDDYMV